MQTIKKVLVFGVIAGISITVLDVSWAVVITTILILISAFGRKLGLDRDIILGPITWTVVMIGFAVLFSLVLSELLILPGDWAVAKGYISVNPLRGAFSNWIWGIFTLMFLLPEWKYIEGSGWKLDVFKVPGPARGAQLTWIGMVSPFILKTGNYPFLGRRFGFGWLSVGSETIAKDGFLVLGDVIFQVWQTPAAESKVEKTSITLQAGNGAIVTGNFSLVLRGRRRILWEEASDAGLQVGNRARQELQEVIEPVIDTDVKSLQGDLPRLIRGHTMLTAFLPEALEGRKENSIVRDKNKRQLFVFVEDYEDEGAAKQAIRQKIQDDGHTQSVAILPRNAAGEIHLAEIKVTAPITELIEEFGFDLRDVIYDTVRASDEVESASNQASAQARQRDTMLASARATTEARQLLLPTEAESNDPHYALRTTLTSATDPDNKGNVKVIRLDGGNEITRSVAAADIATRE